MTQEALRLGGPWVHNSPAYGVRGTAAPDVQAVG
jgi:hypothetical protein